MQERARFSCSQPICGIFKEVKGADEEGVGPSPIIGIRVREDFPQVPQANSSSFVLRDVLSWTDVEGAAHELVE